METLIKDEFIVLKKNLIPDFDLSLTVYFKKLGKENIYIPKGQILKYPFSYISEPFSWNRGIFFKRRDKVYIEEIDKNKNIGIFFTHDKKKFYTSYFFIKLFLNYITFPDDKLFILLKKSLYYLILTKNPEIDKLNFLVKFVNLNGLLPEFLYCSKCGSQLNRYNYYGIDSLNLSPVCRKCKDKYTRFYLTYNDIILLEKFKNIKFSALSNVKINDKGLKQLIKFLVLYIRNNF